MINIDIVNAYNEIKRTTVVGAYMRRTHFVKWLPYWRSKPGPTSKQWAGEDYMKHHEGLVQGSPFRRQAFRSLSMTR